MKTTYIYILLIVVLIGGLFAIRHFSDGKGGVSSTLFDEFGQCLTDAGAIFYGAYWCPHCQNQKAELGNSKTIPYVECSTANGQGQTQQCAEAGITSYPTWRFADGSELGGVASLEDISAKTNCALPAV